MKTLKEALFNKKNLDKNNNQYNISKKDMIGELKGFPVGLVVRMMEEQELQGNKPNIKVFQKYVMDANDGFEWKGTEDGQGFWYKVINGDFTLFFEKYPEYEKYN